MKKGDFSFYYEIYESCLDLALSDAELLHEAKNRIMQAYAPYSKFRVGAAAELMNGERVGGANQENASFPAGLCAERVLLASVSSLYPKIPILSIAISYRNGDGRSEHPIFPCGICRQSLVEFEHKMKQPIRLILGGENGLVYIIPQASSLLPLAFTAEGMS
jgi:cytidine deaminase